nr:hypothetical protein [Kibdelosporangium sp. MJ126-NF4]
MAFIAGARAATCEQDVRFRPVGVDLERPADLEQLLAAARPRVCVVCASEQSPWERVSAPSGWTDLMAAAGFGISLPLQAYIAITVARAVAGSSPDTLVVNACFPDAVNPVLAALGLPIWCGVGNVSAIATAVQLELGLRDQNSLHVLAHHAQLHAPPPGCDEPLVWCDGRQLDDVGRHLATQRAVRRSELNNITGFAAGRLVDAVLRDTGLTTHLPGPLGLPGGYPVHVLGDAIDLRLPGGVSVDEAIAWNNGIGRYDGAWLAADKIMFSGTAQEALRDHIPSVGGGWALTSFTELRTELLAVRERLRVLPSARS